MYKSLLLLFGWMIGYLAGPGLASAQLHFKECATRTGDNATIIIPSTAKVHINEATLTAGDELAVVTHTGACVGRLTWRDGHVAFPIWGDNIFTAHPDGLALHEPLLFVLWDTSEHIEYNAANSDITLAFAEDSPHTTTLPHYAPNAIYILTHLAIIPHEALQKPAPASTPDASADPALPSQTPAKSNHE